MNGNPEIGLQFDPEFAQRVLEAADRVAMRRRRLRRVTGASALCTGIAAAAVWLSLPAAVQGPSQSRNPVFAAASPPNAYSQTDAPSAGQNTSPDALSWFFPDAAPLARYAAEDTPADGDNGAGSLFTDDD